MATIRRDTEGPTDGAQAAATDAGRSTPAETDQEGRVLESSLQASPIHRERAIAEIAYLLAEQRGFAPGYELDDWLAAEREVDKLLVASRDDSSQVSPR
jgi:hypothetical protein